MEVPQKFEADGKQHHQWWGEVSLQKQVDEAGDDFATK